MTQLRPPGLDALGLPAALRWHAGAFESRTGIRVKVTANETLPRPSPAVEDALLRIYIEALNNVANHAAARRVAVSLETRGDAVVTSIADQGRGIDATQRLECTHHQPRSHQQDKRQGYLYYDQYTARMVSLFALTGCTPVAAERA